MIREQVLPTQNKQTLTQADTLDSHSKHPSHLPPIDLSKLSDGTGQPSATIDLPMQEIRRQNDVERWRNKIRLQEKFEVIRNRRKLLCHATRTNFILATLCKSLGRS
jgi:hypothetical protein